MNRRKIWILTMFPEMFSAFLQTGVVGKALKGERTQLNVEINLVQIRDHSPDGFKGVDDSPYGGGPGMVMRPDVLELALKHGVLTHYVDIGLDQVKEKFHVIYTGPRGQVWNHAMVLKFADEKFSLPKEVAKDLIFLCGRYEGVDERFLERYVGEQYSIGDYVLSGGELAVMVMLDSAMRHVPGTLGNQHGAIQDSFYDGLLEYPQYTRPAKFHDVDVPAVLMSGNHQLIEEYRQQQRLELTRKHRPELWQQYLNRRRS